MLATTMSTHASNSRSSAPLAARAPLRTLALLPLSAALAPRERRLLGATAALLGMLVALSAAHALFGLGGHSLGQLLRDRAASAIYVIVAAMVAWRALRSTSHSRSWILFAAGISLYAGGNVLWAAHYEALASPPIPSVCDVLWLSLYPCCYVAIIGLARVREHRVSARIWLDALVAGSGTAAIGTAIVLHPVLRSLSGGTGAVITELAYPVCDVLLAVLIVSVLALRGWRMDRMWSTLGAGFIVLAVADCMYALQVADGAAAASDLTNLAYEIGVALLALGAWQPGTRFKAAGRPGSAVLGVPAAFTLGALGLLFYDHFTRLDPVALALALLTVIAAFARTGLAFRDVRSLAETRLQAITDDLTNMPNRRHFLDRLHREIASARAAGTGVVLLLVDLDHFKELNDTLGHDAGDRLICQVGERLRGVTGAGELAARLGGDEFGVLLCEAAGAGNAERVAHRIRDAIAEPFSLDGLSLRVTASVGIALYPDHAGDGEQLMQHADVAMYEAKAAQSGHAFYAGEHDHHSRERLSLAGELSVGLRKGQIEAYFQPKALVGSGRIVGLEALARWRHPSRGLIGPAEFLDVAEQAGLGPALTRRMFGLALGQLRIWRDLGLDLHVAVNTTVADLQDAQFPSTVAAALAAHGLPPEALVLEVTETSVFADPVRVGDVLARLGELGVGLSLDDFGTGFSSLTHLKLLPVGEVKIDRSFVSNMTRDAVDAGIVRATIQLAHTIGVRVVAEGVEDQDTWDALQSEGCDVVQGYAISPPALADDLFGLLRERCSSAPAPAPAPPRHSGGRPRSPAPAGGMRVKI